MKKDIDGVMCSNDPSAERAEVILFKESRGLPKLSVGFAKKHYVPDMPTATECFFYEDDLTWVTLCNFRRYSWSYASGKDAEYGYAGGPVYANGDIWQQGGNDEVVIRECYVRAIEAMIQEFDPDVCSVLKSVLGQRKVLEKLDWLLADALANPSRFAGCERSRSWEMKNLIVKEE